MPQSSVVERALAMLSERLYARRPEIEQAVLTRAYAVSGLTEATDPVYADGLRTAVSAAVAYGLAAIELDEEHPPPVPVILLAQARLAARNGVGLDTVLRRYCAGHTLLDDFLIEEAERSGLKGTILQRLLRAQTALFDRLLAAVSEEHTREADSRPDTSEQRRAERVERLLAGELLDTSELVYDFEGHHLGAIASGPGAQEAIRALAAALDRRLLLVRRSEETIWIWLGSRRQFDPAALERLLSSTWPPEISLAIGEPGEDLSGWRLTHRQAKAALPIAMRSSEAFVRYADVALPASVLQDDLLVTSLHQLYLAPLERERDGGEALRQTMRAYFVAGRNISSAAAALGVDRHTVAGRLRIVEERLDRPLDSCAAELEVVLRLGDLGP